MTRLCQLFLFGTIAISLSPTPNALAVELPISYSGQIQPILNRACIACHKPEKKKGKLDLATFIGMSAGGENGAILAAGKPSESALVQQVSPKGNEKPAMPEKGEPLSAGDVSLLSRWIEQGAKDDTPPADVARTGFAMPGPTPPGEPPTYRIAPVINAIAVSPDGKLLAVAGRAEVVLLAIDDRSVAMRLVFGSPRITSILFSDDGSQLYAAGGAPGQFGQVQVWNLPAGKLKYNWRITGDTLFGLAALPRQNRVAFGCADKTVRLLSLEEGQELLSIATHTDWVFGTAFSADGSKLITAGRDKCLKLIGLPDAQSILDLNEPLEVNQCLARSPKEDLVVVGCANGSPRLYQCAKPQMRTEQKKDPNLIKNCERLAGPINAVAFSADGNFFVAGSSGEARVFKKDGSRVAMLAGISGAVNAVEFSPDGAKVFAAGFDGKVRLFDARDGKLILEFVPEPWAKVTPTR